MDQLDRISLRDHFVLRPVCIFYDWHLNLYVVRASESDKDLFILVVKSMCQIHTPFRYILEFYLKTVCAPVLWYWWHLTHIELYPTLFAGILLQGANQLCKKHDEKNFECISCGKMFSDQSNCKRHIRHNHLGEDKNAICPNCNKVELKTNMKRHLKKYCVNRQLYAEDPQQQYY